MRIYRIGFRQRPRWLSPHAMGACLLLTLAGLCLTGCTEEAIPPLEKVDLVFWEDQSWESGGGTARLTLWAGGRSEVRVDPGPAHLYAGSELRARSGWQKEETPSGTTFVYPDPFTPAEATTRLAAAVRAGITLLESEEPEYLDGGGVLVGVQVDGIPHQATMPTFNETLEQRARFEEIARALGSFPDRAFEIVRK